MSPCCYSRRSFQHAWGPGLLQLTTVREQRQPVLMPTSHSKCCTRRYEHITAILQQLHWLPVCQRVQFKMAVLMYQVTAQPLTCVPGGRLPSCVCHWTPTTAFIGHRHVPNAANPHTFWRSLIHCCWTLSMEQSANTAARVRHYTRTISMSTHNASIWSLTAAAPSDSGFHVLCINWLNYLLTYLFFV